jgi:hypothetical protein
VKNLKNVKSGIVLLSEFSEVLAILLQEMEKNVSLSKLRQAPEVTVQTVNSASSFLMLGSGMYEKLINIVPGCSNMNSK